MKTSKESVKKFLLVYLLPLLLEAETLQQEDFSQTHHTVGSHLTSIIKSWLSVKLLQALDEDLKRKCQEIFYFSLFIYWS